MCVCVCVCVGWVCCEWTYHLFCFFFAAIWTSMCKNDGIQDLLLLSVWGLRFLLSAATSLSFCWNLWCFCKRGFPVSAGLLKFHCECIVFYWINSYLQTWILKQVTAVRRTKSSIPWGFNSPSFSPICLSVICPAYYNHEAGGLWFKAFNSG